MNGKELYQLFKEALDFFGLNWFEQEKMQVRFSDNKIEFIFDGETVSRVIKQWEFT